MNTYGLDESEGRTRKRALFPAFYASSIRPVSQAGTKYTKGASINDVHENFEFVDPSPPLSYT